MYCKLLALFFLCSPFFYLAACSDLIDLQEPCDPEVKRSEVEAENAGKFCTFGAKCNPSTKLCDCGDSADGPPTPTNWKWTATWEDNKCKLLPGSNCIFDPKEGVITAEYDYRNETTEFTHCVNNAKCLTTRKGAVEDPRDCPPNAPCDLGDHVCTCEDGKTCQTTKIVAPPKA